MRNSKITYATNYKGYPLWSNYHKNTGFYTSILDRILELLNHMLFKHSQVLVVRLDIRFPIHYLCSDDNSLFQGFIENYRRRLADWGFDPHLLWVREQNLSSNHHYHCFILLNGNEIRYYINSFKADELWSSALDLPFVSTGLIHICSINGFNSTIIHRNNEFEFVQAFKLLSYLAKVATKSGIPKHLKMFGSSHKN